MEVEYESLETIRSRLEHEDNLVNYRVSWILSSQAFLLTAYTILLNTSALARSESYARQHGILMTLIPCIGVITILTLWLAIFAALVAMRHLRASADLISRDAANNVHGRKIPRWLGLSGPLLIPAVFLLTWLLIIFT
jgi:hypothetical protein